MKSKCQTCFQDLGPHRYAHWPYGLLLQVFCLNLDPAGNEMFLYDAKDYIAMSTVCQNLFPTGPGGSFCSHRCRLTWCRRKTWGQDSLIALLPITITVAEYRALKRCEILTVAGSCAIQQGQDDAETALTKFHRARRLEAEEENRRRPLVDLSQNAARTRPRRA